VCHVECLKGGGAKVHWKKCGSRTGCKYVKKVRRFRGRFLGTEMRHLERKKDAEQNPIPRYPKISHDPKFCPNIWHISTVSFAGVFLVLATWLSAMICMIAEAPRCVEAAGSTMKIAHDEHLLFEAIKLVLISIVYTHRHTKNIPFLDHYIPLWVIFIYPFVSHSIILYPIMFPL
jgi:hypothetical protein